MTLAQKGWGLACSVAYVLLKIPINFCPITSSSPERCPVCFKLLLQSQTLLRWPCQPTTDPKVSCEDGMCGHLSLQDTFHCHTGLNRGHGATGTGKHLVRHWAARGATPLCPRAAASRKFLIAPAQWYSPEPCCLPSQPQSCSAESPQPQDLTWVHLAATENPGSSRRGSGTATSRLFPSSGLHGHSGAENKRFSFGHWHKACSGQSHQFNSLMFPILLLYHTANFIVEETRQTPLLGAPALHRPLLLQAPLISLAYPPDVPDPQCAIVGSCVEQLVVDLEQQGHSTIKLSKIRANTAWSQHLRPELLARASINYHKSCWSGMRHYQVRTHFSATSQSHKQQELLITQTL